MYPGRQLTRHLGQSVDCLDPANAANADCGSSSGSGFDLNNLINTVLNDITQIVKPGTPQLRPLYTPTSTAAGSLFNNPTFLLLGAGVVAILLMGKRRH